MGQDIRIKTTKIFNAYLTLGLLEIAKEELDDGILSQIKIQEKINIEEIKDRGYIGRYLKDVKKWLKDADLHDQQIKTLIKNTSRGFQLNEDIPPNAYKDFLGAFLFLNLIEDDEHINNLENLFSDDNNREKPLSLVTKLTLLKKNKKSCRLSYLQDNDEEEISFEPKKFKYQNNIWYIEGKNNNTRQTEKLELSRIAKIKDFELIDG